MSANNLPAFTFEGSNVRVFMINNEPWFAATDVARCIGIKDPKDAVKNLRSCERSGFKPERGGSLTIISESGMYTMVLRSDAAIKEGTAAFRFRVWVTDEVLPAIRKQGRYECPAQAQLPAPTLTEQQSYQILSEVAKRCKRNGVHYQTVYRALKARYQVTKYTHILQRDFEDAIEFIRTMTLNVPEEIPQAKAAPVPESRPKIVVSPTFCENMRNFIFIWNYLHRDHLIRFLKLLKDLRSPYAEGLSDAIHSLNMDIIELSLADIGFPVKELDCYKYWAIKHAAK